MRPRSRDRAPSSPPAPARPGLSGQQVLLGLGALLVLAASSIFLLAVWFLVGIAGQALIGSALGAMPSLKLFTTRRIRLRAFAAVDMCLGLKMIANQISDSLARRSAVDFSDFPTVGITSNP